MSRWTLHFNRGMSRTLIGLYVVSWTVLICMIITHIVPPMGKAFPLSVI